MPVSFGDVISNRRLRWLGHLGRMCDSRLPKQFLFGRLPQRCPPHGVKLSWRDSVRKDLKYFNISESDSYVVAQDRDKWSQLCMPTPSLSELVQPRLFCDNCNRSFRRPQDMAKHRCDSIRSRQTAAERINSGIMCSICGRTFRNARICLSTSVYQP